MWNRRKTVVALATAATLSLLSAATARATILNEIPGNQFKSTAAAPTVYANLPQNMTWGEQVSGTWPNGGDSPVTDGDLNTVWASGRSTYLNVGFTAGQYVAGSWVQGTLGQIDQIRIWGIDNRWPNADSTYYMYAPPRIKLAYGTSPIANPSNGYNYNGDLSDPLNGNNALWPNAAPISSVNGLAPAFDADGYAILGQSAFTGGSGIVTDGGYTLHYVDLAVSIPAGATSVALEFGNTYNPLGVNDETQGIGIAEVQAAAVPEPASLGLIGLAAVGLLARRRA